MMIHLVRNNDIEGVSKFLHDNTLTQESIVELVSIRDNVMRNIFHHVKSLLMAKLLYSMKLRLGDIMIQLLNDKDKYGATPLHVMAWSDKVEVLKCYLQFEANIQAVDDHESNILHWIKTTCAAETIINEFDTDIISDLLQQRNKDGKSPLHVYCRKGLYNLISFVLKYHTQYTKNSLALLTDQDEQLPLHVACEEGNYALVNLLLQYDTNKSSLNHSDICGWTPLHSASVGAWPLHQSSLKCIKLLVEACDNPKEYVNQTDKQGLTALHSVDHPDAVIFLIQSGARSNALDIDERTPLHLARSHQVADALMEYGQVDIDVEDRCGRTPLFLCAAPEKANLLMMNGCDKNRLDCDAKTALDWAIQLERKFVVEVLVKHGALKSSDLDSNQIKLSMQRFQKNKSSSVLLLLLNNYYLYVTIILITTVLSAMMLPRLL